MYKHILIPTDNSEQSLFAAVNGLRLAKALGAQVTLVTVARPYYAFTLGGVEVLPARQDYKKQCEAEAARIFAMLDRDANELGLTPTTRHIVHDHVWKAIIETAETLKCDLIHMGSHGRSGLAALILGSQTQKVLTHTKIPVLVYR